MDWAGIVLWECSLGRFVCIDFVAPQKGEDAIVVVVDSAGLYYTVSLDFTSNVLSASFLSKNPILPPLTQLPYLAHQHT